MLGRSELSRSPSPDGVSSGRLVGVVALQGDVSEHLEAFRKVLGEAGEAIPIRRRGEVAGCDALSLPGGESTTIGRLLAEKGIGPEIAEAARRGVPVLGTCAGLVLLAKRVTDELERGSPGNGGRVTPLGLMDIAADRNAFGRQRESFEANLDFPALGREPCPALFIRAPAIASTGPGVEVLARHQGRIVAARQGNLLALAFHPELTGDPRPLRYFLAMGG
ncbi:MAG: pyridoxal 5'-phosphate synthase glutaminase subunit PdxT [Halobacteria archaeon]